MKKITTILPITLALFLAMLIGCTNDSSETSDNIDTATTDTSLKVVENDTTGQAAEAVALAEAAAKAERDSILAAKKEAAKKETPLPRTLAEAKPKPKPKPKAGPIATWESKTYNFGTVTEGEMVKHDFIFKNTGTTDLVVKDASASCGCTVPGFSFFPVEPGQEGVISVSFNSAHKAGHQKPRVTVITNGYPSKHVLNLEGSVQSAPKEPSTPPAPEPIIPPAPEGGEE